MNGTLTRASYHITETPAPQDFFATAPMQALWQGPEWQREEEVYSAFEAAISSRVLALKERHIGLYTQMNSRGNATPAMNRLVNSALTNWHKVCSKQIWKRSLLLLSAALLFMLIGFDLMGLLVLSAR